MPYNYRLEYVCYPKRRADDKILMYLVEEIAVEIWDRYNKSYRLRYKDAYKRV